MWQRGCFPTKILAWPHRLYRMRDRCAVLRTWLQCVCTQRRNCIGQLSPFSEYAPTALRNKWKRAATIKLMHYRRSGATPHESSVSGGYLVIECLQRFQSFDATHKIAGAANRRPLRREPAGFAMPFIQPDNGSKNVFVHISAVDGTATSRDRCAAIRMPGSCLGGRAVSTRTSKASSGTAPAVTNSSLRKTSQLSKNPM